MIERLPDITHEFDRMSARGVMRVFYEYFPADAGCEVAPPTPLHVVIDRIDCIRAEWLSESGEVAILFEGPLLPPNVSVVFEAMFLSEMGEKLEALCLDDATAEPAEEWNTRCEDAKRSYYKRVML